ncbi:N-acetylglucosamine-6-phosphate deacetylase [Shimia sp. SK013]|uniref:N-acetylglucosamine-6-phosphate deacetylase n=1 Tax=Shimia sp. SK013 TaxID=1389006 RepID=UPI0006B5C4C5|nr:N-acetylglucosamine-6-phosphate deacetylase [Shimia sp. SK013]KPA20713.1 N-acetylglucosamine-6-phosphate deacetylase [Shimia sp. SK013]
MTFPNLTFRGGPIFDGEKLLKGFAARFESGVLVQLGEEATVGQKGQVIDLGGDILSAGFVDLQVNGGDGVMLNDAPSVETLARIADAHRRLGCRRILPTLITDTKEKTDQTIAAVMQAVAEGIPEIAGLHLEGPHLSVARKGAHDADLIRPMTEADLATLIEAAEQLPALMVTLAPESVSLEQVRALSRAGVIISLGHTDASFDTCVAYFRAGARCATHLFNAMSQLGNREPGLVGAVLSAPDVSSGIIADGIHVHPETLKVAWHAKSGRGRLFLVSDAMAVAGTDLAEFQLEGRTINRKNQRLTLEDGTLAGADLELTNAIKTLVKDVGIPLEEALQAATTIPAKIIGEGNTESFRLGTRLRDTIRIAADLSNISLLID